MPKDFNSPTHGQPKQNIDLAAGYDALEGVPVEVEPVSPWDHPVTVEGPFKYAVSCGYALSVARRIAQYKNNALGFRMAGSKENHRAASFLQEEMKRIGIPDVELTKFPVHGWSFREASLSVEDIFFTAIPYVSTPSTAPAGISAPLVYVGSGTRDDYKNISVQDQIVLIGLDYHQLPWPSLAALQAEQHGAAAVVIFNLNGYGQGSGGTALTQQDWSNHAASIPVINVSPNCGLTLAKAASDGNFKAELVSKTEEKPNTHAYNVIGKIPGQRFPNEYVLLGAHYDGYFQGFQDDALGVGVGMAIIKAILEGGCRPQRTIVLALVDAEEFGVKGVWDDWLIGSWNLIKGQREWIGRMVGAVNLELMAYHRANSIAARANDELITYLASYCQNYRPDPEAFNDSEIQLYRGVTSWTDEWSYSYFGAPTFGTKADPEMIAQYYHTQYDTEDLVCPRKADEMVRFYGGLLLRLDSCLYHPYDFSVRPREYADSLQLDALAALGVDAREPVEQAALFSKEALGRRDKILAAENCYRIILEGAGNRGSLTALRRKVKTINAENRALAKEIMDQTQYLGGAYPEAVIARAIHYQHDYQVLCCLEELIGTGKIAEAAALIVDREHGIHGLGYAPQMTKELFRDHYILGFFGDKSTAPRQWTRGKVLYYHDLWDTAFELSSGKPASGSWQPLLERLTACRKQAEENLLQALAEDAAFWRRARQSLKELTPVPTPDLIK